MNEARSPFLPCWPPEVCGREREREAITGALDSGRGVLIVGPAGAGKSSLLEWAAWQATARGAAVARAHTDGWLLGWLDLRADEGEGNAWAQEALRHHASSGPGLNIERMLTRASAEPLPSGEQMLETLTEECLEVLRMLARSERLERRLPQAWAEGVVSLCGRQPEGKMLCLVVDEAHLAPDLPWAALTQAEGLWLAVACEDGPAAGEPAEVAQAAGLRVVRPGRLASREVGETAAKRGGRTLAPGVAETVAARTDSSFALMTWLQREGTNPQPSLLAAGLYLEECAQEEKEAAQAAALVPGWFAPGLIAAMLVRSPAGVEETLSRSSLFGRASEGEYAFAHPLFRSAAQVTMTTDEAASLHDKAGEWVLNQESSGAARALGALSVHTHGARHGGEGFQANLAWARHCLAWGMWHRGLEAAERALICAAWEGSAAHQLGAMGQKATLLLALGRDHDAARAADRAASLAREAKMPLGEVWALATRALALRQVDRPRAAELLARAVEIARPLKRAGLLDGLL